MRHCNAAFFFGFDVIADEVGGNVVCSIGI
jgi:hypothetical protein